MLERLKQHVKIRDTEVLIYFYVVPRITMSYACLLGRHFISDDCIEIRFGKIVNVRKRNSATETDTVIHEIMNIDVADDASESNALNLNVNQEIAWEERDRVKTIISECYVKPVRPEFPKVQLKMNIVLKPNHKPFYFNPRRLSGTEKLAVAKIIRDLLERKIIRVSNSPYGSSIVLVLKKCGNRRLAIDFRFLNEMTIRDNFPIPRIEDLIDSLRDKTYFTQLDLKDAFHHVELEEKCIPYTSFVTFMGQYEYVRMPFGLKNGPSFFMRFIKGLGHHGRSKIAVIFGIFF